MNKSKISNSNEEYFSLYQYNLELTKNIFKNTDIKIKIPKNFDKKFRNINSKGIVFGRTIILAFLFVDLFLYVFLSHF